MGAAAVGVAPRSAWAHSQSASKGEPAQLDRLPGHGKRPGDDGLAGDDRSHGGENDHRHQQGRRAEPIEEADFGRVSADRRRRHSDPCPTERRALQVAAV
jgi:hypothetical protein